MRCVLGIHAARARPVRGWPCKGVAERQKSGEAIVSFGDGYLGRSGFDLSVSGRPPTSSEAAGPLEKKQNKHCFLAVTPPLSTWWVDQARRRRKFYGGTTL